MRCHGTKYQQTALADGTVALISASRAGDTITLTPGVVDGVAPNLCHVCPEDTRVETDKPVGHFGRLALPQRWLRERPGASPQQPRRRPPRGLLGSAAKSTAVAADAAADPEEPPGFVAAGAAAAGDARKRAMSLCASMCE